MAEILDATDLFRYRAADTVSSAQPGSKAQVLSIAQGYSIRIRNHFSNHFADNIAPALGLQDAEPNARLDTAHPEHYILQAYLFLCEKILKDAKAEKDFGRQQPIIEENNIWIWYLQAARHIRDYGPDFLKTNTIPPALFTAAIAGKFILTWDDLVQHKRAHGMNILGEDAYNILSQSMTIENLPFPYHKYDPKYQMHHLATLLSRINDAQEILAMRETPSPETRSAIEYLLSYTVKLNIPAFENCTTKLETKLAMARDNLHEKIRKPSPSVPSGFDM